MLVNIENTKDYIIKLRAIITSYFLKDIYNIDKTKLF